MASSTLSMSGPLRSTSRRKKPNVVPDIPWLTAIKPPRDTGPTPAATSRGFHRHVVSVPVPARAKTDCIGFLHLPDHVRKTIYELAIYDHDRAAVFLPRALPRKVVPEIDDVDLDFVHLDSHRDIDEYCKLDLHWTFSYRPQGPEDTPAAGVWIEDADLSEATFSAVQLPFSTVQHMTDEQILEMIDGDSDDGLVDYTVEQDREASQRQFEDYIVYLADTLVEETTDDGSSESLDACEDINAGSSSPNGPDPNQNFDIFDYESDGNVPQQLEPVDNDCGSEGCGDPGCHSCCDRPENFEYYQEDDRNVFSFGENAVSDDEEHYDTEEQFGMIYEPKEPHILLACKEIRDQCLPIYYSRNAFSWRFSWTDYQRSSFRFKSWLKSMSADHVKLNTRITFQGRHMIEEGADFSADIDLLDEHPFFETRTYADDENEIAEAINRELAMYLWLMVQHERSQPTLSVGNLRELANIFVAGMHRDGGGGLMMKEAAASRLILSPLF